MNQTFFYLIAAWMALLGFGGAVAILVLQSRALRITGHPSLKILVASTWAALGTVLLGAILQFNFWQPFATALYLALAVIGTLQFALGIWGTALLLEAFSRAPGRSAGGA